jgi:hypothetical protein
VDLETVEQIPQWLDRVVPRRLPKDVAGFSFNLTGASDYGYDLELVGTPSYDPNDSDWACDDIWTADPCRFDLSGDNPATDWEVALARVIALVKSYIEVGKGRAVLRAADAVGVGFTDGDLHVIWPHEETNAAVDGAGQAPTRPVSK